MHLSALALTSLYLRTLAILLAMLCAAPLHADSGHRFEDVERIVAFGDVHGDLDALTGLLRETGIVDAELKWQGGQTHLVSTGDLVDRGDHGRQVIELLMRLQSEAAEAGGAVHVLIGNHEAMVLSGDLRYVSDGDYEQYGGRAQYRAAFSPEGEFGRWLLDRPFMIVIDDTAFVHGGLSRALAGESLEQVNASAQRDLRRFAEGWHALLAAEVLDAEDDFVTILSTAHSLAAAEEESPLRTVARDMVAAIEGFPFQPDGPLWYRGSSRCHPYVETEVTEAVLEAVGAERVAVGHTVTLDRAITSRMDGRVIRMDTGMNEAAYGGRPAALVIEGASIQAHYVGEGRAELTPESNRTWARPHGMSDAEIEAFLRTASVVHSEEIGTGVTQPRRVTMEQDGRNMRAAFVSEDTDPNLERRSWYREADFADRHIYNFVAYKLDRLLGLELVPVTVLRTIDDVPGALTYWIERSVTEAERRERGIAMGSGCDISAMHNLMNVFDVLIFNVDRNLGNILYDTRTWDMWLIDHTRAFGTQRGIPRIMREARIRVTPEMAAALERVNRENLSGVEPYLHHRQVQALIHRAQRLRRR